MRLLLIFSFLISVTATPSLSWSQESGTVGMQSQLDPEFKAILEIMVNMIVKRFPVVGEKAQFSLSEATQLAQGNIAGTIHLESADPSIPLATDGDLQISLKPGSPDKVLVRVSSQGQMPAEQVLAAITAANNGVCIGVSDTDCAVQPLLQPGQETLPASQKAAIAFSKFKENLIAYMDGVAAQSAPKTQTFGEAEEEDSGSGPIMDAETALQVGLIIDSGLVVSEEAGTTRLSVDMEQVRNLTSDLSSVGPGLQFLITFENFTIDVTDSTATYGFATSNEIPARAISTYDAYVQLQQAGGGLAPLRDLLTKIGPWVMDRCTANKMQEACINKVLSGCTVDVTRVQACVDQATKLQAGLEGDMGAIAAAGVEEGKQRFWDFLLGNNR